MHHQAVYQRLELLTVSTADLQKLLHVRENHELSSAKSVLQQLTSGAVAAGSEREALNRLSCLTSQQRPQVGELSDVCQVGLINGSLKGFPKGLPLEHIALKLRKLKLWETCADFRRS